MFLDILFFHLIPSVRGIEGGLDDSTMRDIAMMGGSLMIQRLFIQRWYRRSLECHITSLNILEELVIHITIGNANKKHICATKLAEASKRSNTVLPFFISRWWRCLKMDLESKSQNQWRIRA